MTVSANAQARPAARRGRLASWSDTWRRRLLIGLVAAYVGLLILAPIGALVAGAFAEGFGAILRALSQPDVLLAFWRTLYIALITVGPGVRSSSRSSIAKKPPSANATVVSTRYMMPMRL